MLVAEVDAPALPRGPVDLAVAAGVDEHRGAAAQRRARVLRRGGDGPVLAQEAEARHRQHQVVGQLVKRALDAEVGVERQREDGGVGRDVAARVVAHQQDRSVVGDVAQAPDLAAEVEAGQQPHPWQRLADVVGVARVEVGGRDALLDLGGQAAQLGDSDHAGSVLPGSAQAARAKRRVPSASVCVNSRRSMPTVCSGRSTWGTWPQPSRTTCSAPGSASATWRRKPAGISLS